jgi:hypothetical protein
VEASFFSQEVQDELVGKLGLVDAVLVPPFGWQSAFNFKFSSEPIETG